MIFLVTCTIPGPFLDSASPLYASNSSLDAGDNVIASQGVIVICASEHDSDWADCQGIWQEQLSRRWFECHRGQYLVVPKLPHLYVPVPWPVSCFLQCWKPKKSGVEVTGRRHSLEKTFTFFTCAVLYWEHGQQSYSFIINLNQNQQNQQRSHSSGFKDHWVRNNPLKTVKFISPGLMTVSWSNTHEMQSIVFCVFAQYSVPILMGTTIIRSIIKSHSSQLFHICLFSYTVTQPEDTCCKVQLSPIVGRVPIAVKQKSYSVLSGHLSDLPEIRLLHSDWKQAPKCIILDNTHAHTNSAS